MNKKNLFFLILAVAISIFLHLYKVNQVPPCINADEVAFSYNAYSLLKTGKDEYGKFLPLRLQSFLDYKLPLYAYFSIPIIAIFGLNDFSTRALNILIGVLFVPLLYLLASDLFNNKKVGIAAALIGSLSPGVYILSRHAHEGVISSFFVLLAFLFLIRYIKSKSFYHFCLSNFFILLNAFSYQTGRIYLLLFFSIYVFLLLKDKKKDKRFILKVILSIFIVCFSLFYDYKYGLNRVNNLFFFKNIGFKLTINEYLGEHPNRIIHNKVVGAIREISKRYIYQLSPQYFLVSGDTNWRFGFPNLGLFTLVEFIFFLAGIYYLLKNKERFRFLLLILFFVTPLNNAFTWQDPSLIRTYLIIFLVIILIAYGITQLEKNFAKKKYFILLVFFLLIYFAFDKFLDWDLYFNHYPKRAMTVRAWQCGYRELVDYVKKNYHRFAKFYITDRHGQPYIFFLYFWPFDPGQYQKQAKISTPDQYGFGQIAKFDKFEFRAVFDKKLKDSVFIGYPETFNNLPDLELKKIKKIIFGGEEIFWIYENK